MRECVWGLKACSSRDAEPGEVLHVSGTRKSQGLPKTTGPASSESSGGKHGSSDGNPQTLAPQGPGLRSCFRVGVPSGYCVSAGVLEAVRRACGCGQIPSRPTGQASRLRVGERLSGTQTLLRVSCLKAGRSLAQASELTRPCHIVLSVFLHRPSQARRRPQLPWGRCGGLAGVLGRFVESWPRKRWRRRIRGLTHHLLTQNLHHGIISRTRLCILKLEKQPTY